MPSNGKPSEETLALIAEARDGAPMRTECFFCDWTFVGTAGAARDSARTHREQQHPEASVPRARKTIRMKKRSLRSKEEEAQAALDAAEANRVRAEREDAERLAKVLRGQARDAA